MNATIRILLFLAVQLLCFRFPAGAQTGTPVSRNPVKDVAAAQGQLFALPAEDSNFFFRADLPGGNFLTIRFNRLRDWSEGGLPEKVTAAAGAWSLLKDSFVSATASRKLSVHLPPSGYPMIAAVSESGGGTRTLLLKAGKAQPLRVAVDTIVVLQALPEIEGDNAGNNRGVQYTFLLKDMADIEGLAADTALTGNVSRTFDSLVAATRMRRKSPDAHYHALEAQYDIREGPDGPHALSAGLHRRAIDNFDYYAELGTGFVAGAVAATSNFRLSWFIRSSGAAQKGFVALSLSGLTFVSEGADDLNLRLLTFLNFEMGSVFKGASGSIPLYQTSVGVGYRVGSHNRGPYDFRYRLFFHYSLSRAITVTPEFYMIPKDGDKKARSFSGMTVSLRLF